MPKDRVSVFFDKVWGWFRANSKILIISASVIVVIILSVFIGTNIVEKRRIKAEKEYLEIIRIDNKEARLNKLEEYADKYDNTGLAIQALMELGNFYYDKKEYDKASDYFKEVMDKKEGELIYYIALRPYVASLIEVKKGEEALKSYSEAAKMESNPWPDFTEYRTAYLYQILNRDNEARKIYENLLAKDELSPSIRLKTEENILWLTANSEN